MGSDRDDARDAGGPGGAPGGGRALRAAREERPATAAGLAGSAPEGLPEGAVHGVAESTGEAEAGLRIAPAAVGAPPEGAGARSPAPSDGAEPPPEPRIVLVVDSNRVIRQLIRVNLELAGFEVVSGAAWQEALELLERFSPEVLLLSDNVPDGPMMTARWSTSGMPPCPTVLVWSVMGPGHESVPDAGFRWLAKPFEPQELVRVASEAAGAYGAAPWNGPDAASPAGRHRPLRRR